MVFGDHHLISGAKRCAPQQKGTAARSRVYKSVSHDAQGVHRRFQPGFKARDQAASIL
jgi:hypothetical protein